MMMLDSLANILLIFTSAEINQMPSFHVSAALFNVLCLDAFLHLTMAAHMKLALGQLFHYVSVLFQHI